MDNGIYQLLKPTAHSHNRLTAVIQVTCVSRHPQSRTEGFCGV